MARWQDVKRSPELLERYKALLADETIGAELWWLVSFVLELGQHEKGLCTPEAMANLAELELPVVQRIASELLGAAECGRGTYDFGLLVRLHLWHQEAHKPTRNVIT